RLDLFPDLVEECTGRSQAYLRVGVLLVEGVAVGLGARATRLRAHDGAELVEEPAPDTERPTTVVDAREVADTDAVQVSSGHRLRGQRRVAVVHGDEQVVERVVDASGPAQSKDVPVLDERDLLHRHD